MASSGVMHKVTDFFVFKIKKNDFQYITIGLSACYFS